MHHAPKPIRTTGGLVQGARYGELSVYKGIPFASPPIGPLRWREPQLPAPWTGVLLADKFAPAAMQSGVSMPGETPPVTSEDCLYLNIWTRASRDTKALPVMVWIYGGGFTSGSASMPLYWGDRLSRKGVIVVTFGYRVGPFGFLAHPELTLESPHRSSGNYGLMDQIAALKWVKRNIGFFGGDANRVTIAGQSAGGASVNMLMSSPLAKGLFHQAIIQSGGMYEPVQLAPRVLLSSGEREGEAYAKSLGVNSIADLRALPASELLKGSADQVSHPVLDPYVLPDSPYNTFMAGKETDVPVLVGSNADEARALITDLDAVKASTFSEDIAKSWGALPPALLAAYPFVTDEEARKARLAFERDLRFGWDAWACARLVSSRRSCDVYYYHFTHRPPFPADSVRANWGPSHYAELWYMFDHLNQETWAWSPKDRKLADTMSSYWTNFIKSGNPNGRGLPLWPKFTPNKEQVQYLDDMIETKGVANLKSLRAVDAVYSQVRGAPLGH